MDRLLKTAGRDHKMLRMIVKEASSRGIPTYRDEDANGFGKKVLFNPYADMSYNNNMQFEDT